MGHRGDHSICCRLLAESKFKSLEINEEAHEIPIERIQVTDKDFEAATESGIQPQSISKTIIETSSYLFRRGPRGCTDLFRPRLWIEHRQ